MANLLNQERFEADVKSAVDPGCQFVVNLDADPDLCEELETLCGYHIDTRRIKAVRLRYQVRIGKPFELMLCGHTGLAGFYERSSEYRHLPVFQLSAFRTDNSGESALTQPPADFSVLF